MAQVLSGHKSPQEKKKVQKLTQKADPETSVLNLQVLHPKQEA